MPGIYLILICVDFLGVRGGSGGKIIPGLKQTG